LIATDVGAVELDTIHRFTDPAEAAATVKLRVGDTTALDFYQAHHRIVGGSRHAMLDAVYTGWHTDIRNGQLSIMCAATNTDVTHLAACARLDRVTLGHVEAAGTPLHDGNQAGRDDWIVTRLNRRRLTCNHGRDFVRNGDGWTVTARHRDGSLTARNLRHHGTVRLPASYVAQHVELMYATTVHRAQGDTVDTTHALITPDVSRENLYVAATRGRHHTRLYTVTHDLLDLDEDRRLDRVRYDPDARAAREVLETILTTDTAELTATETLRTAQTDAASLATLMPRMIYAAEQAARPHHQHLIQQMFGPAMAARITADPAWPSVTHTLIAAEQQGWPADQLLAAAARSGPMTDARSAAELLTWRLDHALDTSPPPARLSPPEKAAANHYADLLDHYTGHSPRIGALLSTPPGLRTSRRTTEPDDAGYTAVDSAQLRGYANLVATHTGASPADVTAHHTWPQLAARLTAWHRAGHDPADLFPGPERPSLIQVADVVRRHADRHHRALATPIPTALRQHDTVTAVLGAEAADTVRSQPGWPALDAALGRAHQAGHDTHHALTTVARHRSLGDAQDPALVLAWRLNRYLAAHPAPGNTADDRDAWATIGWILAAHENVGGDPETLLHDAPTRVPAYELAAHLNDHARAADTTRRTALGVPPWTPPATTGSHPEAAYHAQYLANSETAIAYRVRHLIDDALTHQPAWLAALGDQPTDTDAALTWHRHVGIVAAYRDQHHVTDDDPRHPLGPYVEPGHAGHRAYWHAAHAVIEAHASHSTTASAATGSHQMTVDLYLALNETAQHDVAATVVARLGALWFGSSANAHEAIIEPAYAARLRRALHDHGHLPESERRASTTDDPATSRTPRTQPQRPSQTRTARTPEQRRQRRSAAANAAEPAATQTQRPRPSDPNPEPPIHHRL
jgi:hypothetical protein